MRIKGGEHGEYDNHTEQRYFALVVLLLLYSMWMLRSLREEFPSFTVLFRARHNTALFQGVSMVRLWACQRWSRVAAPLSTTRIASGRHCASFWMAEWCLLCYIWMAWLGVGLGIIGMIGFWEGCRFPRMFTLS